MMKANKVLLWLALPILGLTTTALAKDDDLPKTESFTRYAAMLKHSPFAVATAAAPLSSTPDFAKDLYVANAAHMADGDYVTLASTTDKNLKEYLNTKGSVDGYSISNIQWSDKVGETKVTISKDGQFATLTFNEALLSQAIQNPVAQVQQPQQAIPGRPQPNYPMPMPRPMAVPSIPTPPPHVRPTIRRKATPQQPYQQPQPQPRQRQTPAVEDDESDTEMP
jgi:hypothetical protein